MKTYEYKGFNVDGKVNRGLVEALSVKEAREKLASRGVLAERIQTTGRRLRFPVAMRAVIYRELSALLHAGVPLSRALEILIDSPHARTTRALLAGVRDRVREGASLADAVSEASQSVAEYEQSVLVAGEASATIADVLERLADYLEEQDRLKERIRSALIYPAVVVALGLCVAGVMLGVLVPRARELLLDSGQPLPLLTQWTIGMANIFYAWGPVLIVMIIFVSLMCRFQVKRNERFRLRLDQFRFAWPLWGKGYVLLVCMRFSRTLAVLMKGGVSLIESVRLAGKATGSSWVNALVEEQADAVRHGARLSQAIATIPPLADTLPGWIQIGEESGNVAGMMEHAGARYEERWERFLARALVLLEPILMLLIGGFVLLVTLSLLLPIIAITRSVG